MLTGLLTCGDCEGSMEMLSSTSGISRTHHLRCYGNGRKGSTACANKLVAPMPDAEAAVLRAVEKTHPAVVERAHAEAEVLRDRSAGRREAIGADVPRAKPRCAV